LDREVNLVAVDLPGHGLTPGPPKTGIGDLAQWVADLVAGLELPKPPVLGGVSLGGAVVLETVLSRPGLAAGLLLISSSAHFTGNGDWRDILRRDRAEGVRIWAQALFSSGTHPGTVRQTERILSQVPLDLILADLAAGAGFDRRARLGEVKIPALVLCGGEDRITPPEASALLAAGLPDARLEVLAGAGHLVLVEKPGLVNQIILEFIREKVTGRPAQDRG
jgi:3-oxoadipate enol-lactonase/3-oxoadipate enol-lactonase/4-carboxymuconolactone decarboxylase